MHIYNLLFLVPSTFNTTFLTSYFLSDGMNADVFSLIILFPCPTACQLNFKVLLSRMFKFAFCLRNTTKSSVFCHTLTLKVEK